MPYLIKYSPRATRNLKALRAKDQAVIKDKVQEQLLHQAGISTRNRKQTRQPWIADWELRIGAFRVFYDIVNDPTPTVAIVAIGIKKGNTVWIDDEEYHYEDPGNS